MHSIYDMYKMVSLFFYSFCMTFLVNLQPSVTLNFYHCCCFFEKAKSEIMKRTYFYWKKKTREYYCPLNWPHFPFKIFIMCTLYMRYMIKNNIISMYILVQYFGQYRYIDFTRIKVMLMFTMLMMINFGYFNHLSKMSFWFS